MSAIGFIDGERQSQAAFFARTIPAELINEVSAYRLKPGQHLLNLAPAIRTTAAAYFGAPRNIVWHRHANHGLSSQVCCLNFLMPLATQPVILARWIEHTLGLDGLTILPPADSAEHSSGLVAFEWTGLQDYLNEWPGNGKATRGANATSADAAVTFRHEGKTKTVLIEWKYTESYGQPLEPGGNATRAGRYRALMSAPNGPIRADAGVKLEDFFWEPLYQLLRQQMLAWRMEQARENGAEEVSILHISPSRNRALHKVTSPRLKPFGDDVFAVFRSLLATPGHFLSLTTEQAFGPLLALDDLDPAFREWAAYLSGRYRFLSMTLGHNG